MWKLETDKQTLRKKIRRRSAGLPGSYWKEAGQKIAEQALNMPEYRRADVVLGFASMSAEPDLFDFLRGALSAGKRLAVPLCTSEGVMEAREIHSLQELRPGKYGIPEPAAHCPVILPKDIEFALIPCVSCTASGTRLGHGGGYYDRYLANYHGAAALVCPEALMSIEIPAGKFDISIPLVITEHTVYRYGTATPSEGCGEEICAHAVCGTAGCIHAS